MYHKDYPRSPTGHDDNAALKSLKARVRYEEVDTLDDLPVASPTVVNPFITVKGSDISDTFPLTIDSVVAPDPSTAYLDVPQGVVSYSTHEQLKHYESEVISVAELAGVTGYELSATLTSDDGTVAVMELGFVDAVSGATVFNQYDAGTSVSIRHDWSDPDVPSPFEHTVHDVFLRVLVSNPLQLPAVPFRVSELEIGLDGWKARYQITHSGGQIYEGFGFGQTVGFVEAVDPGTVVGPDDVVCIFEFIPSGVATPAQGILAGIDTLEDTLADAIADVADIARLNTGAPDVEDIPEYHATANIISGRDEGFLGEDQMTWALQYSREELAALGNSLTIYATFEGYFGEGGGPTPPPTIGASLAWGPHGYDAAGSILTDDPSPVSASQAYPELMEWAGTFSMEVTLDITGKSDEVSAHDHVTILVSIWCSIASFVGPVGIIAEGAN